MLKLGAYTNFLIAFLHISVFICPEKIFALTGVGDEMAAQAAIHGSIPYLLTVFVMIVFTVFGLYGLSAAGTIRELPFLKFGIYAIATIFLLRGVGELIYESIQGTSSSLETIYSFVAVLVGLLYLLGGREKWNRKM